MKLVCDAKGDFVVEPSLLAARFAIDGTLLRHRMRLGLVTSLVEAGAGADEGKRRLTVRCGNTVWRAIVDAGQNVLNEETFSLTSPQGNGRIEPRIPSRVGEEGTPEEVRPSGSLR